MIVLFYIFLGSLLTGQLGGLSVAPGVVVYIHDVVLLVWYIIFGIRLVRNRARTMPRLLAPIMSFCIVGLLSLAVNSDRFSFGQLSIGGLYLLRWMFYAGLYLMIAMSGIAWKTIMRGLYQFGVVFGILGVCQYVLYPDLRNLMYLGWDPHYYRLVSTFLDPNFAGCILVLTFLLGLHIIIVEKKTRVYYVAQAVVLITIYLTYSRSAFVALAAGVIAWFIVHQRWRVIVLTIGLLGVLILFPASGDDTHKLLRIDTSLARVSNWLESASLVVARPIFGHGFNMLRFVWGRPLISDGVVTRASSGVDSSVLFVLATSGILGLLSYAWIYVRVLGAQKKLIVPLVIALFVNSVFINSAFYPWIMLWIWVVFGAVERMTTSRI